MKKFTFLFAAMLGLAGQVSAQSELELTPGWNCSKQTVVVSNPDAPQLPATVTLSGNFAFVTVTEQFSSADYPSYKFVFGEPIATANLAATCKGDDFRTAIEQGATEFSGTFSKEATITRFGIQNTGSESETFILKDFILYKGDGTEWHPTLKAAFSWTDSGAGSILSEGAEQSVVWSFNQWGTLGYTFPQNVTPGENEVHRFVVTSSESFPEGFQFKVVRGSNDGDAIYPVLFTAGGTTATLELSTENIKKTEDDAIDYFTGVQIQAMANNLTLPTDVKMTYERVFTNGLLSREQLPVKADAYGDDAKVIDPNPGMDAGANGLPVRVTYGSQWQDVKLWQETFSAAEYPACRIILDARPTEGTLQFYYRTAAHGSSGGVYVPTEDEESMTITETENGVVYEIEFDLDELGEDLEITRLALQSRVGDAVSTIIKNVYLMNEDEEWIETAGLTADGWNPAKMLAVGGSYDADGNIWDAYVDFYSSNSSMGSYSGTVAENTYHKVTFTTEEPLPEGFMPVAYNLSWDSNWNMQIDYPESTYEGQGTNVLSILIPRSYQYLVVQNFSLKTEEPVRIHFKKIVREVYEGLIPTAIKGVSDNASATVKSVQYFDAAGVQLTQPTKGMVIVRETLSNGSVRAKKVMIK